MSEPTYFDTRYRDARDDLTYRKINRLSALLLAASSLLLVLLVIVGILLAASQTRQANELADRIDALNGQLTELRLMLDEQANALHDLRQQTAVAQRRGSADRVQNGATPPGQATTAQPGVPQSVSAQVLNLKRQLIGSAGKAAVNAGNVRPFLETLDAYQHSLSPAAQVAAAYLAHLVEDDDRVIRWGKSAIDAGAPLSEAALLVSLAFDRRGEPELSRAFLDKACAPESARLDSLWLAARQSFDAAHYAEAIDLARRLQNRMQTQRAGEAVSSTDESLLVPVEAAEVEALLLRGYIAGGRMDEANALAAGWQTRDEEELAIAQLWALHLLAAAQGDDTLAMDYGLEILRQSPSYAPALHYIAQTELEKGSKEKAVAALRRYLAAAPQDFDAAMQLGDLLLNTQAYAEAAEEFQAIWSAMPEADPRLPDVLYRHAAARINQGICDESTIGLLDEALQIRQSFAAAHFALALCQARNGHEDQANLHLTSALGFDDRLMEVAMDVAAFEKLLAEPEPRKRRPRSPGDRPLRLRR